MRTLPSEMTVEDRPCPRCGSRSLHPVDTAGGRNLVCGTCRRCWHQEQGFLVEVNRYTCPGCHDRSLCSWI